MPQLATPSPWAVVSRACCALKGGREGGGAARSAEATAPPPDRVKRGQRSASNTQVHASNLLLVRAALGVLNSSYANYLKCCEAAPALCEAKPTPNVTVALTAEIVQAAAMEVSELAEYYTYDPSMDTSSFSVGEGTFLIASELRHQVNMVASALASTPARGKAPPWQRHRSQCPRWPPGADPPGASLRVALVRPDWAA